MVVNIERRNGMTLENTINVKSTSLKTAKTEPVILKRTDRFSLNLYLNW